MEIRRPSELAKQLGYILAYAPDLYPPEAGDQANSSAFRAAFRALQLFQQHTDKDGKERLSECELHLTYAFEFLEEGSTYAGLRCIKETIAMFKKCRPLIAIEDDTQAPP